MGRFIGNPQRSVVDTLKIQNVSDEVSYLDSIGRKKSAEVIRQARISEAEARAQSESGEALPSFH